MKKLTLACVMALGAATLYAADPYIAPAFDTGWSFGIDGGGTTPLKGHAFFGDMRGMLGAHLQKQISPAFALGVESYWAVNTSSWTPRKHAPAFDDSYTGVYGALDLPALFGGFRCQGRVFGLELAAGAGFGHVYDNDGPNNDGPRDQTYFATKAGVNFNFNVNKHITLSLRPSVTWNMTGSEYYPMDVAQTSAAYDRHNATFNIAAGVAYRFGDGIRCARTTDGSEIDALNARVNELRGSLAGENAALAAERARTAELQQAIADCNKANVRDTLTSTDAQTILYVYYELSSPVIRESQVPVVEMVADYLKHHPAVKVIVKGYASQDGEAAFNEKLSGERAEAVKNMLTGKFGIPADRIEPEGCGILTQFKELSWNRVAICIITE